MSGGHFDYIQYRLQDSIDRLEEAIRNNDNPSKNDYDDYYEKYSRETIKEFDKTRRLLELSKLYLHRVDWLLSGDDGEETFHERLLEDLGKLFSREKNT